MNRITSREKAREIARIAAENKGEDIVLMDMRGLTTVCDWFVLNSAASSRRVNSITRRIQKDLSKKDIEPIHVEGRQNPYWSLLDYGDVVAHIFHRDVRDFYGLERLWSDATIEKLDDKCLTKTSRKR